jgi:Gas vesicle synthesis protein GvpL/GvpF
MSGSVGPGPGSPFEDVAHALAPELLAEVIADSRRDAVRLVRDRLTQALVHEMTESLTRPDRTVWSEHRFDRAVWSEHRVPPISDPPAEEAPARSGNGEPAHGWYVYGITWAEVAETVRHHPGIDGADVEPVVAGHLAAVVSPVAANGPWGTDPDGNLDMATLGPKARDHERILEELMDSGPVLPLRFGVMYTNLDDIRRVLLDRAGPVGSELERLTAHREWGLTLRAEGPAPTAAIHDISEAGRGYLDRRRQQRIEADAQRHVANQVRQDIHDRLLQVSATGVVLPVTRADGTCLLRASYLVPDGAMDDFRAAAESALAEAPSDLGVTGELTGPWPPYHFTDVRLDDGVSA